VFVYIDHIKLTLLRTAPGQELVLGEVSHTLGDSGRLSAENVAGLSKSLSSRSQRTHLGKLNLLPERLRGGFPRHVPSQRHAGVHESRLTDAAVATPEGASAESRVWNGHRGQSEGTKPGQKSFDEQSRPNRVYPLHFLSPSHLALENRPQFQRVIGQDSVDAHIHRLLPIGRQIVGDRRAGNERSFPGTMDVLHLRS